MSNSQGGKLDGGTLLNRIALKNPELGQLLQDVIDGVNHVATNASVSAVGDVSAPKAPDSVSVNVAGEMAHISINHTGELNRGIHYFSEITSDDPACAGQPITVHHGATRTPSPIVLPTTRTSGTSTVPNNYKIETYAQYPGGPPSAKVLAKTTTGSTSFKMGGSTNMSLLPGHGSGTASNNGGQRGQGFGSFQHRTS